MDILKGSGSRRNVNHAFLKKVALTEAEQYKGETLHKDKYLDFLEGVRKLYSAEHTSAPLDRIKPLVTRILKLENKLEVRRGAAPVFDSDGNKLGNRTINFYTFKG